MLPFGFITYKFFDLFIVTEIMIFIFTLAKFINTNSVFKILDDRHQKSSCLGKEQSTHSDRSMVKIQMRTIDQLAEARAKNTNENNRLG
jgi:amino acid permease